MEPIEFKEYVRQWAERIGIETTEIHIRHMTKKWASCSSKGRLTFDPSVMDLPEKERNEVVIHELLHLRYPNHGRMFKIMLTEYLRIKKLEV